MNEKKTMTKDEALKLDSVQAKPEPERVASQEPVAWMHIENYIDEDNLWDSRKLFRDYDNGFGVPLYTTPPQRTWVGLTDEDIEWCYEKQKQTFYRYKYSVHGQQITKFDDPDYHLILAVTAKLKQKNGFTEEKNT